MATVYCDGCGTSLEETAKFCRVCGKATPLSEAATKRFDEQPEFQNRTSPVGVTPTTPAYLTPSELPLAFQTNDLQAAELRRTRQKRNLIILVSMMAVMILALAGLLAFLSFRVNPVGPDRPFTELPPPPPPPPPPGFTAPTGAPAGIDPSLKYPGSKQT